MGGSGGGQHQVSETGAAYPEEFRPLATAAVNQIKNMQIANPLSQYAAAHPQSVAGIAPLQQAAMNLGPKALQTNWGLETMQNMTQPLNTISQNAAAIGNVNPYASVLQALGSGGFGAGKQAFPGLSSMPQLPQLAAPIAAPARVNQTVAGPNTQHLFPQYDAYFGQTPFFPHSQAPIINTPVR